MKKRTTPVWRVFVMTALVLTTLMQERIVIADPGDSGVIPACEIHSYKYGRPGWLKVRFENVAQMHNAYVAAASANAADSIWMQRGKRLKKDGDLSLEGYAFEGKVVVYLALSQAGEKFMKSAQRSVEYGNPITQEKVDEAQVVELCEYDVE